MPAIAVLIYQMSPLRQSEIKRGPSAIGPDHKRESWTRAAQGYSWSSGLTQHRAHSQSDRKSVSTTTESVGNALDKLLAEACDRNAPAEICFAHRNGPPLIARVRLLDLSDEFIHADKPGKNEQNGHIPQGRPITVHVSIRGARYLFDSVIVDQSARIQLNSEQRIPGIVLRRPKKISKSERRSSYRVPLAGIDPIQIELARGHPDIHDACLLSPGVLGGRMLNLSAGGVAVLLDRRDLRTAKRGDRYFLGFSLPGVEERCCQLAEVRHVKNIEVSESIRLAFAFVQWGGRMFNREQNILSRFITEQQRRRLRLRK